jgi:hypothetical protein
MTLDEAIKVLRQHNEKGTSVLRITEGRTLEKDLLAQVLDSCEQLISEKSEYKRLLKLAVGDLRLAKKCQCCKHQITGYADICYGCHFNTNKWEWRYVDEALKLIGDESSGI